MVPGPSPVRRLSRTQYTATVRDLLNLHVDIGATLPADSAGGEGFDNAAETLFLSPIYAEKYLEAAKLALSYASKDARSRARFLIAAPGPGVTPAAAANTILEEFLPRAFRRPVDKAELDFYMDLFSSASKRGESFEEAILYSLRAALLSPQFLFRMEPQNSTGQTRLLDDYSLASRLSYFLWGSTPDGLLLALADTGKLKDPRFYAARWPNAAKSEVRGFRPELRDQWLRIRDLGQAFQPDPKLFPNGRTRNCKATSRISPFVLREIFVNDLRSWTFSIPTGPSPPESCKSAVPDRHQAGASQ
jgi:hypothetical protein